MSIQELLGKYATSGYDIPVIIRTEMYDSMFIDTSDQGMFNFVTGNVNTLSNLSKDYIDVEIDTLSNLSRDYVVEEIGHVSREIEMLSDLSRDYVVEEIGHVTRDIEMQFV